MNGNRGKITEFLNRLEYELKELEIAYEKYFLGTEKRAPETERQKFTLSMRKTTTYYIPQTDLRFRLQSVTSRYNSYCSYWDRILRLIDEGRYERHTSKIQRRGESKLKSNAVHESPKNQVDNLYEQLLDAHQSCQMKAPNKDQVVKFLDKQKEVIKQRFGDKQVDFFVVTEAGKPKIKVRAKS